MGKSIYRRFEKYATSHSFRFQTLLTLFFMVFYVCIIAFGFTWASQGIDESGFSTGDLQNATSRNEVQSIVGAWASVMSFVYRLYVFDYLFILTGVLLFFSLNGLLFKNLKERGSLHIIPKIGLVLTILSRTLDSMENLFTILIFSDPDHFNMSLLPLLSTTSVVKWIVVTAEYSVMFMGWICVLVLRVRKKKN